MIAFLNVFGLILNLAGVILLFRYGMPYRVRTDGRVVTFVSEKEDLTTKKLDRRYDCLGWIGLICVIFGTVFQILATVAS
jgi:hypothetical protein